MQLAGDRSLRFTRISLTISYGLILGQSFCRVACFLEREVCCKLHVFCVFLRENYLFNCTCPKCESQSGDPDVTSSEDDDDSMEEDSWHWPWLFLFIMGNREFVKDTANVVFHLEMPYLEYYSLGLYAESGATLLVGIWWWENKNK